MLLLLCLSVLLGLVARDAEGHYTCNSQKFDKTDDLPECFFRTLCDGGKELNHQVNAYTRVYNKGVYRYYGSSSRYITVDVNGYVLFGYSSIAPMYPYRQYYGSPRCYNYDMAAVFWAATDTRFCGKVCYRETEKMKPRRKFRDIIASAFSGTSGFNGFTPTHVFTVTYFNVDSYYQPCCRPYKRDASIGREARQEDEEEEEDEEDGEPKEVSDADFKSQGDGLSENAGDRAKVEDKDAVADNSTNVDEPEDAATGKSYQYHGLNSYQIAIGTDGYQTYVIFNYAKVQWTDSNRNFAGFWTDYRYQRYPRAFYRSWSTGITDLMNRGNPAPSNGCAQYAFRVDEFSYPFIRDPKPSMTKFYSYYCYCYYYYYGCY